jgi:hypothetical protein
VVSWADCRGALAERVRSLTLDGLDPERVHEHLADNLLNITYPCVELSLAGLVEKYRWWTTDHLMWEYPVGLLIVFRDDPKNPLAEAPYLSWRSQIAEALPGWNPEMSGLFRVRVEPAGNISSGFRGRGEPGQVRDPQGPAWLKVAGAMVVTFEVVKARG